MRKKRVLLADLLLVFSMGFLSGISSGFAGKAPEPGQPKRPQFFALQIVDEKNVQNARYALGAPDGRYAEILPGGQLIILMEKAFIDIGTLVFKGEMDYGLEGFFHIQNTQDERQDYAWIPFWTGKIIPPGMWPGGFSFGPGRPSLSLYGGLGIDKIRVTNVGNKSLSVDAVIGYGIEVNSRLIEDHIGPKSADNLCQILCEWQRRNKISYTVEQRRSGAISDLNNASTHFTRKDLEATKSAIKEAIRKISDAKDAVKGTKLNSQ